MAEAKGEVYSVILRAGPNDIPAIMRLRRFVKMTLRAFRLVAEDVRELYDGTDAQIRQVENTPRTKED
jgi:hypothetical protein